MDYNFIFKHRQSKHMIDKFYRPKKRANSSKSEYEHNKQLLPLIKPRYIHEKMFPRHTSNVKKIAGITKSVHKHSESTINRRCETEASDEAYHKQQYSDMSDLNRIRYKLKDFYKNMPKSRIELQTVDKKSQASSQQDYSDPSKIHFSFLRRRIRRHHQKIEDKEEIYHTLEQEIYPKRILYTPVLLKPSYTKNIQTVNTSPRKCKKTGNIKRQSFKDEQEQILKMTMIRREKLKKSFKKIGNAILFVAFLKRYNKKYQQRRKRYLQKTSNNLQSLLMQFKLYFSDRFSNFYQALCRKYQKIYHVLQTDSEQVKLQKLSSIKTLVGILIDCISKSIDSLKGRANFIELIYALCKHGSFSCQYTFHTLEELDISCVSPQVGYIRGDCYLQKSYIIAFVFIKIIIFNILLKPELIHFSLNPLIDRSKLFLAVKLLGNIFYEMMIDMQDDLLEHADDRFKIGNWRGFIYKFDIRVSESMTVKKGFYQKNELISGLNGHSFIEETYRIDEMKNQLKLVQEIVLKVHLLLKEYHVRVSKNCM